MKKVTMNLTDIDIENAERIESLFNARSKAQAVSTALSLASKLLELICENKNNKLLIEKNDGSVHQIQILIPGINNNVRTANLSNSN